MEGFFRRYKEIVFFMIGYWLICVFMFFLDPSFLYIMLAWNVLLAVLPLFFIGKSQISLVVGRVSHSIFWMIPWVFFFPNSLYMITDFIHISSDKFMWIVEVERYSLDSGVVYSSDIIIWLKLLVIGIGFLFALLVGLESLYTFERNIKSMAWKYLSYFGVLLVSFLSGIGIYIGRFLRFNSWDIIFNPIELIKELTLGINTFAIQFIIAFTVFIILCFNLYKIFRKRVSNLQA